MARNRRPTIILVMAILNMVMGGITLLCGLCAAGGNALVATLGTTAPAGAGNPMQDMTKFMDQQVPGWQVIEIGRGLLLRVFAVVLVVSGIGLLKMHSWARWLSVAYAAASLFLTLGYMVFEVGLVVPAMEKFQAQQPRLVNAPQQTPAYQTGQRIGSVMGVVMVTGISVLYAIALAIVMFLPSVNEAFARRNRCPRYRDDGEEDDDPDYNDSRGDEDDSGDDDDSRTRRRRRPDY